MTRLEAPEPVLNLVEMLDQKIPPTRSIG